MLEINNFGKSVKTTDFIWINGKIVPWDNAYIHVLTHSLHYSGAVYEGERAYNGKVFKLREHTNRLLESAKYMQLEAKYSVADIEKATEEILQKNNLKNAYVRPLIWRGAESLAIYNESLSTNILILAQESNPKFQKGTRLVLSPWRKFAANTIPVQAKSSAHYAMLTISQKLAKDQGYDDALMLDQFDDIAESTTANIFFGRGKELVTPIADRFLNGITRQTVIEIAKNIGIKVKEERLAMQDIEKYDTCFICGTALEIKGVASVNDGHRDIKFPNDSIVEALQMEYAKIVGKEII